jgi:phage gp45-like
MFANLMRWARVRGLVEGKIQKGRVEGLPNVSRDDAQRPQDYGFAANAVAGEGLVLEVGGHTVIVRLDRIAERPQLAAYEVAIWHKEGHTVRLRAGRIVQVDCDQYVINANQYTVNAVTGVAFNTPKVNASAAVEAGTTVQAQGMSATTSLKVGGKEVGGHYHGGVAFGTSNTANF